MSIGDLDLAPKTGPKLELGALAILLGQLATPVANALIS